MFGLLLVPLVAAVGMGVDFTQSSFGRTQISEATDAAVLAAARAELRDDSLTLAEINELATDVFNANINKISGVSVLTFNLKQSDDGFSASVKARYNTIFMKVVGRDKVDIDIFSRVEAAPPRVLEAVLVLDNTGSMSGAKIKALKDASRAFVDSVMDDSPNAKVGVVPFADYVNVGLSNRNAFWMDVPSDKQSIRCRNTYPDKVKSNCELVTKTCYTSREMGSKPYTCTRQKCDVNKGEPVEVCSPVKSIWKGCAGSRSPVGGTNLDSKDGLFTTYPVPGLLGVNCPLEILPLTSSKSSVETMISKMKASGETYIPAGLTWGHRVISSGAPFTEGETITKVRAEDGKKAIVLMTDGENVKSASYPRHNGNNVNTANGKTIENCDEVKAQGIELYTIAFEVTDTDTKDMLKNCATGPEYFFDATDASQLVSDFKNIAADLKELALAE